MPEQKRDLPRTIERSDKRAQEIYTKTHDSAVETYGEGSRAHRTAFAALKHSYKKEGDRWVPKARKGPSDPGAVLNKGGRSVAKTAGGEEVPVEKWPKDALHERARQLDISSRGAMSKDQLVSAIKKTS